MDCKTKSIDIKAFSKKLAKDLKNKPKIISLTPIPADIQNELLETVGVLLEMALLGNHGVDWIKDNIKPFVPQCVVLNNYLFTYIEKEIKNLKVLTHL